MYTCTGNVITNTCVYDYNKILCIALKSVPKNAKAGTYHIILQYTNIAQRTLHLQTVLVGSKVFTVQSYLVVESVASLSADVTVVFTDGVTVVVSMVLSALAPGMGMGAVLRSAS